MFIKVNVFHFSSKEYFLVKCLDIQAGQFPFLLTVGIWCKQDFFLKMRAMQVQANFKKNH